MKDIFAFFGLGLIGGSIARAIRQYRPEAVICAWDPDQLTLHLAKTEGVIDHFLSEPDTAAAMGDSYFPDDMAVVFLSASVEENIRNMTTLRPAFTEDMILTDVGSVKGPFYQAVKNAGLEKIYIGGHPMAGSERTGYRNSKVILLENAYYILTPSADCAEDKRAFMNRLVSDLHAIPLLLDPEEHDFMTGAISHVPHVVSAALVNLVRENDDADAHMKRIAAGGFKDITRISSSSPEMWEQICMANGENIGRLLDLYIEELTDFRKALSDKNAEKMRDYFENARSYREGFADASAGPIKKEYVINVEIEDQPGMIAEVALLLANRRINIKNIGITHNRETASGALRIEFHDEKAAMEAQFLLISKGYKV